MGLLKISSAILVVLAAIWWAIAEKAYIDLVDGATLQTGKDPQFTIIPNDLADALSCPVEDADSHLKERVLLVHGTGMSPQTNWDHTLLPPLTEAGFTACYLAIPSRLLHDIQISAEYISHAIKELATTGTRSTSTDSNTGTSDQQISIISWSAGALTTQWVMTFYPETRAKVKRHIAIGADFHGSWVMTPLLYFNLYTEAIVQQVPWSKFLSALVRFGGSRASVPTTCIGSSTDLIVQPGFYGEGWSWSGFRDSWRLTGSNVSNIDVFKLCAKKSLAEGRLPHVVSHDSLLWEAASHRVIFDALANDETFLGTAVNITADDCRGVMASNLPAGSEEKHGAIMPELSDYASKMPLSGWPEVPLFEYADFDRLGRD